MTLASNPELANKSLFQHSSEASQPKEVKSTPLAAIEEYAKKAFQREMKRTNGEATVYSIPVMNYPIPEEVQGEEYILQRRIQLLAQLLGAMSDIGYNISKYVVQGAHPEDLQMLIDMQGTPRSSETGILHSVVLTLDSIDAISGK
jgi:hypothetical protein